VLTLLQVRQPPDPQTTRVQSNARGGAQPEVSRIHQGRREEARVGISRILNRCQFQPDEGYDHLGLEFDANFSDQGGREGASVFNPFAVTKSDHRL
jgi:hypothetical protein